MASNGTALDFGHDLVSFMKHPGPVFDHYLPQVSFDLFGTTVESSDIGLIAGPVTAYWIYSTALYVLETLDPKFLRKYKIDPPQRPKNKVSVGHVISRVALQHFIQMLVAIVFVWIVPRDLEREMEDVGTILIKLMIGAFMLDTYQYWMHRLFHRNKFLYRHFHSVHHELTVPYAFGALYNHPGTQSIPLFNHLHLHLHLLLPTRHAPSLFRNRSYSSGCVDDG